MTEKQTYRVRFRFHLAKRLQAKERERRFTVAGREVVLKATLPHTDIADDDWLVMNATGFESEHEAREFGRNLKAATDLSSVTSRLGVNVGDDRPMSGTSKALKDAALTKDGTKLRDNVHGIDVFVDDSSVRIFSIRGTGTVRAAPEPFLSDLDGFYKVADTGSQRAKDIVLLLNYAVSRSDPVAQIIFAVSAVEMLGQGEIWTETQKELLEVLAHDAEASLKGSAAERWEVSEAIRRSMHSRERTVLAAR